MIGNPVNTKGITSHFPYLLKKRMRGLRIMSFTIRGGKAGQIENNAFHPGS